MINKTFILKYICHILFIYYPYHNITYNYYKYRNLIQLWIILKKVPKYSFVNSQKNTFYIPLVGIKKSISFCLLLLEIFEVDAENVPT